MPFHPIFTIFTRMILPKRWFNVPEHVKQHAIILAYYNDITNKITPNVVVNAGRRSFKTELMKRSFVRDAVKNEGWTMYLCAPTRTQAKSILWTDIKDLSPNQAIKRAYETDLTLEYKNGSRIILVGLEAYQRVEGTLAHRIGVTEAQQVPNLQRIVSSAFQPMLNDTSGQLLLEGRPSALGMFHEYFQRGQDPTNRDWASYHWISEDVLSPQQIERAKAELSPMFYAMEYLADFSSSISLSYHAYTPACHDLPEELQQTPIDPNLPLYVFCDFNASECPMSWGISQFRTLQSGQTVHYIHETLSAPFTNTQSMCEYLADTVNEYNIQPWTHYKYKFFGDYAGNQHSSQSNLTDWEIIKKHFHNALGFEKHVKPCKSIYDSVASTNARLQTADGRLHTYINKALCQPLIDDFKMMEWDDNSRQFKKVDPQYGHICRALDYLNDYLFPQTGSSEFYVGRL